MPSDVTHEALAAIEVELAHELEPITPEGLLVEIEALRNHFSEWADLEVAAAKRLHRDWIMDFDGYPAHLVKLACSRWRKSSAPKAPTPGQLMAQVQNEFNQLTYLSRKVIKAREILGARA